MGLFTKTEAPLSFEQRSERALSKSEGALSLFHAAADDLESAALDQEEIGRQATEELARLTEVRRVAFERAMNSRDKAAALRKLIGD